MFGRVFVAGNFGGANQGTIAVAVAAQLAGARVVPFGNLERRPENAESFATLYDRKFGLADLIDAPEFDLQSTRARIGQIESGDVVYLAANLPFATAQAIEDHCDEVGARLVAEFCPQTPNHLATGFRPAAEILVTTDTWSYKAGSPSANGSVVPEQIPIQETVPLARSVVRDNPLQWVVITRQNLGLVAVSVHHEHFVAAPQLEPVDPTGFVPCLHGTLVARLARLHGLSHALQSALLTARDSATREGGLESFAAPNGLGI